MAVLQKIVSLWVILHIASMLQPTTAATLDSEGNADNVADGDFQIEYSRYLKQVSELLDADESFQEAAKSLTHTNEKEVADTLMYASPETRSKLDELKRIEVRRLKDLHKKAMKKATKAHSTYVKSGIKPSKKELPKTGIDHIDSSNPSSFGGPDLHKLITKTLTDMSKIDELRKVDFKNHELRKAYDYKTKFRDLSSAEQQKKLKEHLEKARKHPKINHPGGVEQLKEVWEKTDHMNGMDFNPRIFFMTHDIDGDGLLDPSEVEALFERELDKIYRAVNSTVDGVERNEDMNRMREHVFTEVDTNRDGMVDWEEFRATLGAESQDEGWESVQDKQQFTDEELKEFEEKLQVLPYQ